MKFFKLFLITFLLMGVMTAWGTTQTGELSFTELEEAAKQGNADAQFQLGLKYLKKGQRAPKYKDKGLNLIEEAAAQDHSLANRAFEAIHFIEVRLMFKSALNHKKALKWFEKYANERPDTQIQHVLGFMYYLGIGTPPDKNKAFEWFKKAADQGLTSAQFELGLMYSNGQGITQDKNKAFEWFKKAAEQGHAEAQYRLGAMYYFGVGTPEDEEQALEWFNRSAEQGHAGAQKMLDIL